VLGDDGAPARHRAAASRSCRRALNRDGVPEPFPELKDKVNVPRHSVVRFIVHYTDHSGEWMFHCHILDHEDHGMMGILAVR
jgi:FtsP/CotA-like multicopper oxidase with cupredoxin domain